MSAVHEAFEFKGQQCFKTFGEDIAQARRDSDKDKSKALVGELMKLKG